MKDILLFIVGLYVSIMFIPLGVKGVFLGKLNLSYLPFLGFIPKRKIQNSIIQKPENNFTGFKARFYGLFFLLMGLFFIWVVVITDILKLFGH